MTDIAHFADGLLDLDAWDRLEPLETKRLELVDGIVIVTPRPAVAPHILATAHLTQYLQTQGGALALPEPGVVITDATPATVRVPDLVVAAPDHESSDDARFQVGELLLVVEIVSPGSRRTDYVAKRYDYEQARIPYYWIVDPAERRMTCLKLADGHYRELPVGSHDRVTVPEPFKIDFSWDELLHR